MSARNLKMLLYMFEQMSRLEISFLESEVLMVMHDERKKQMYADLFNCLMGFDNSIRATPTRGRKWTRGLSTFCLFGLGERSLSACVRPVRLTDRHIFRLLILMWMASRHIFLGLNRTLYERSFYLLLSKNNQIINDWTKPRNNPSCAKL